ncbi:cytochrome P450 [Aspergillus clavatus NRRL 1]|uniref:Cytochrome P450, putative n=1 Tax=Aspergillus clavatus (strain ATCC 1007 / CBS 513.65 / DSM 816 / NCTC 3887 / NRRL 1 / QM 1276 / 107) TaxID=344612 RepID=A1CMZ8_ASPCL|nr:cytochrome P450, putative [Aspergillus clavatus NRRL 1]EAW08935.1 cytochrome P450, putative [Aspergillus clavatus NRRL 1]
MTLSLVVVALLILAISIVGLRHAKHDPREPPIVHNGVPVLGHVVGFIRHGINYYAQQSAKHGLDAFTMDMLFTKIYVITSPTLVVASRRHHRTMSFEPFITGAAKRMAGLRGPGLDLLREKQFGGKGVHADVMHAMRPSLEGAALDRMNEKMIRLLVESVDELPTVGSFDFHEWCRSAITIASTDAVYGPLNPYKAKELQDAFWDFEANLAPLLMDFAPWLTARKAWKARELIVARFLNYYRADGHLDSSQLTYTRWEAQHRGGATVADIARLEAAAAFATLSNTVPAIFWMVFDIYSRPALLEEIRAEVTRHAVHVDAQGAHVVDLTDIRENCPLLVSTFQETLRLRSNTVPVRVLYEDTVLNDQYLLKKGGILQMPATTINRAPSIWGRDAAEYDAHRFIKIHQSSDSRKTANGFLSFGTSPHMCPGRHFATGEILALTAMLVVRYDLAPKSGVWKEPKINLRAVASSTRPPATAVPMTAMVRKEFEGVQWTFRVSEGKGRYGLIIG